MDQIVYTHINIQRKITSPLLCQLCFKFLLYHTSKIQHLTSNITPTSKIWYKYICIFEYFPIQIFVRVIFVSFFWYKYILIFIRIIFLYEYIRIFACIGFYTNIIGYSFVSTFHILHTLLPSRVKFHNLTCDLSICDCQAF